MANTDAEKKVNDSEAKAIAADAAKLKIEREEFEAEKAKLAEDKIAYKDKKEAEEAAFMEKQAQIDEYQDKVKSNNREIEHIDFDRTNIKFIGRKRVGKPTAKAPTERKGADGTIVKAPKK